ncbi:hypothetical protein M378DRAFT_157211 [Amanita muscaria Koide BX008]|uniref:Uncharacterized protein n=1 Tax=Amanita muscaria (strain Koide BX008) TaxID=946122 RepID=A0A0C2XKC9_AMAMK|nr:hypothetical protein M378DRAFT_157211 [Amanita muscaria Koide BX008]
MCSNLFSWAGLLRTKECQTLIITTYDHLEYYIEDNWASIGRGLLGGGTITG